MCIFCAKVHPNILIKNSNAFVIFDKYPVTEGHCLIIPFRHLVTLDELTEPELLSCHRLIRSQQEILKNGDKAIRGFNVGANIGSTAGQTIFHCHIHLIPRRDGDCTNPEGGVRNILY